MVGKPNLSRDSLGMQIRVQQNVAGGLRLDSTKIIHRRDTGQFLVFPRKMKSGESSRYRDIVQPRRNSQPAPHKRTRSFDQVRFAIRNQAEIVQEGSFRDRFAPVIDRSPIVMALREQPGKESADTLITVNGRPWEERVNVPAVKADEIGPDRIAWQQELF